MWAKCLGLGGILVCLNVLTVWGTQVLNAADPPALVENLSFIPLVQIEETLYFLNPSGENVKIPIGEYHVQNKNGYLALEGQNGTRFELAGEPHEHEARLGHSVALLIKGEKEDQWWLAFLEPSGMSIESAGFTRGIRSRSSFLRLNSAQRSAAVRTMSVHAQTSPSSKDPSLRNHLKTLPPTKLIAQGGVDQMITLDPGHLNQNDIAWVDLRDFGFIQSAQNRAETTCAEQRMCYPNIQVSFYPSQKTPAPSRYEIQFRLESKGFQTLYLRYGNTPSRGTFILKDGRNEFSTVVTPQNKESVLRVVLDSGADRSQTMALESGTESSKKRLTFLSVRILPIRG